MSILSKFGFSSASRHEKAALKYQPAVDAIQELSPKMEKLSDEDLKQIVIQHKGKDFEQLEAAKHEIFAAVREAASRTLKMRHFNVQILGGLALLDKAIAEMKTGEGKTLAATLPITFMALTGKGAHVITVNDYLAERDADWMRPVYEFFDLTVGVAKTGQTPAEKREAYEADVTYGTNNEFGFDYLRDNMATAVENMVQRPLNYALVDEVDSILIDEARTPLIISAPDTESTDLYRQFAQLVPRLKENDHYNVDEKRKAATLTDDGVTAVEKILGVENIYAEKGMRFVHHLEQALRAQMVYHRDKDYVVQEGQVIIVDEFTGRLMPGRRYSDGLHQALEAKEKVTVQQESRTLASITFQNYFRLYNRLAGMTGTAVTSAEEFEKVYNLDVIAIPSNKPLVRQDKTDRIYINLEAKFKAVARELKERHAKGQPVLVGTIAIEKSEYLSALLTKEGVPHEVLNAKHHAREAEIVSQAGQKGAITISTNMAGRGTDIKLGPGVPELGGLFVLGTERHEARRIDNQLRGRSGRQGDPGESQFFVSLDDDVMRIFGGQRLQNLMARLKVPENEPIENRMVSRAIENAQERVEGHYFDMRKQVLSYDDVMNRQRNAIYALRRAVLEKNAWKQPQEDSVPLPEYAQELARSQAQQLVSLHTGEAARDDWNIEEIAESIHAAAGVQLDTVHEKLRAASAQTDPDAALASLTETAGDILAQRLEEKSREIEPENFARLTRAAALRAVDVHWMEHLDTMDYLRTGIGLRGYGQRDPLVEYQKEGHQLFQKLLTTIEDTFLETLFRAEMVRTETMQGTAQHQSALAPHQIQGPAPEGQPTPQTGHAAQPGQQATSTEPITNPYKNIGRNDPCPCGSGKKYKKCGLIGAPEHKV